MLVCVFLAVWGLALESFCLIRVRGFPERRMQVPVCGTGRGLDSDARFVVVVVLVVVVVVVVLVPSP